MFGPPCPNGGNPSRRAAYVPDNKRSRIGAHPLTEEDRQSIRRDFKEFPESPPGGVGLCELGGKTFGATEFAHRPERVSQVRNCSEVKPSAIRDPHSSDWAEAGTSME